MIYCIVAGGGGKNEQEQKGKSTLIESVKPLYH